MYSPYYLSSLSASTLLRMAPRLLFAVILLLFLSIHSQSLGQARVLEAGMHHLRKGDQPEWASFPPKAKAEQLTVRFTDQANPAEQTLRLRQQDVKQAWPVTLNGRKLGALTRDENDMIVYLAVPPGTLRTGENTLLIEQSSEVPDDIRVGEVALEIRPLDQVLTEATVEVEVTEAGTGTRLPARLTIARPDGVLQTVGAQSGQQLAVRPGFVYTGSGTASFGLPAGTYTLYATRGFEYGVDSIRLELRPGEQVRHRLTIGREVATEGWISSDTHIHTFTHSGHGDATVEERVLSIAGEGLELPVLTDHNVHIDIRPTVQALGMSPYYTPVMGNELTTPVGHFNIFPVPDGAAPPDHQVKNWQQVAQNIAALPGAQEVVLNHARDTHIGFRPFGPYRHLAVAGQSLDNWTLPANAMEVINSGATRHDWMQLYHDWFGMLNRGHRLTPVGASDSHDVGRYIVGQGRTYIRSRSEDPGRIDVPEAMQHFRDGKVMVSFGLMAELEVNGRYGPGELAPAAGQTKVAVRVLGPAWIKAERVTLYANGQKIREAEITDGNAPGVKWSGSWTLPRLPHDVFLVAVAEGPDPQAPFWLIAKPYQPPTPEWQARVFGSSGAVWVDADRDGSPTSAYAYAQKLVAHAKGNTRQLFKKLAPYDETVAVQVAALLQEQGQDLNGSAVSGALAKASPATRRGFDRYRTAWQASQGAREGQAVK
jgi:hypothetical protein